MDRKGQVGLGMILVVFIGVIVALALFTGALPFIGTATNTALYNATFTTPALGASSDLTGQELLSTPVVINATGGETVAAANYTIAEGLSAVDGLKRIIYTTTAASTFNSTSVNITYTYGPEGYIESAGGRSIAGLIAIFAALAVAVIALVPALRNMAGFK